MPSLPTLLSRRPYTEPVKEVFIPVKTPDGEVTLRCWRDSIYEPLRREILEKKVRVWVKDIQIQEEEIQKQFLSEGPHPSKRTIKDFLLILKNILQEEYRFLRNNLEGSNPREEMVLYESDHPLILFLELPQTFTDRVFYNVERLIPPPNREFIRDFIKRHNEQDGVMLLRVIWDFE